MSPCRRCSAGDLYHPQDDCCCESRVNHEISWNNILENVILKLIVLPSVFPSGKVQDILDVWMYGHHVL